MNPEYYSDYYICIDKELQYFFYMLSQETSFREAGVDNFILKSYKDFSCFLIKHLTVTSICFSYN